MGSTSNNNSGCGGVPPGFRFHPTDEELLHYYLKKKVSFHKFEMEVIRDIDLNKLEPWDLQERCRIGSTPQNEWYFFSHKDRKYPTGSRTNRATNAGFWKATGRDKCIRNTFQKIGMRKTLVFYRGRAPHGQKTDWIMHEYRLEDSDHSDDNSLQEDGWVVCRVFKKKNLFKMGGTADDGGSSSTTTYTTTTNNVNNNNINMNSSSDHHHLLLNGTSSNNNNSIMHTNLQYYDLLRQQPPLPNHHYLMATPHHPIFELNNKPEDHNSGHDHDLALHSYAPQHQYYYGQPPPAPPTTSSDHHQDQWTMLDRIVTATTANSTSTTDHNNNNNNNDEALLLLHTNNTNVGMNNNNDNQLSLGASTGVAVTAEMDFWGGYAK